MTRPQLVDSTTIGMGSKEGEYAIDAWLVTTDRFRDYESSNNREAGTIVDNTSKFDVSALDYELFGMVDDQTNVTSWAWNEHLGRLMVLRLGAANY
jgi:hypothetical protein